MLVKDLMTKNVISVSPEDMVSTALSKMKKYSIHQLPVIEGNETKGILLLNKIITKDIDPARTKAGSMSIPTPFLKEDENIEDAVRKIINSGMRAIPVMDGNVIVGILSETDLLSIVKNDYSIDEIMVRCHYLSIDDDVGKLKKLMAYKNISRVPIVDKGKVVGMVSTLDLIDLILKVKQPLGAHAKTKERGFKEPLSIDKMGVGTVMKKPVVLSKGASSKELISFLTKKEEVIIRDNNEFCIVTPKDILELMVKPEKGVYFHIVNLGEEDSLTESRINQSLTEFIQKTGRFVKDIQPLYLYIERHEKLGKTRYAVRTRFLTTAGLFVSKSHGWDLVTITQEAMKKLEKEVFKKYDKMKKQKKQAKA